MKQIKFIFSIMLALLLTVSFGANAQQAGRWIIKGVVSDDMGPVMGATVAIKTSGDRFVTGTSTDMDGNYMLEVTIKDPVLTVTFIGMKQISYKPKQGETQKNFELVPDVKVLGEVVVEEKANKVVDDGILAIDKRNLATSTTSVKLDDIAKSPATNVSEMMQGRAAGVQITATSGDPGAGYTIRIRGNASINGSNDPLIVIDGVPYDISLNGANISDLTSSHSPISNVNPADIESIDILKDAASTAQYGARGANGVVLITTKRGAKNSKTVNFNSTFTMRQAPTEMPLLNGNSQKTFILEGDQRYRDGNTEGGSMGNMDALTYPQLRDDPNRADFYYYNNNTDWVDLVRQTGYQWDNNFSLRGGGNTTRYAFSVGYTTDKGTTIGGSYNRFTSNFNLDYNIASNLTFKTSIGYTRAVTGRNGNLEKNTPLGIARQYPAFLSVYEKDALGNNLDSYYLPRPEHDNSGDNALYPKTMYNPLAWTRYTRGQSDNNNFRSNVNVTWEIVKGLQLRSMVAVDFNNGGSDSFIPSEATNRDWNDALVNKTSKDNSNSQTINQQNDLSYKLQAGDTHQLNFALSSKIRYSSSSGISMGATNTGSPALEGVDASNKWTGLGSSEGRGSSVDLIATGHYMLLDRYIIQGTYNSVASTRFGKDQRWKGLPTVALAYRLSGEPFMQPLTDLFLSEFKIRYSIGDAGREPPSDWMYINTYGQSGDYLGDYGISSNNIQLNNLKWEITRTNNWGFNMGLFNDRLTLAGDYYNRMTYDLLYERPLPSTSGYGTMWTNFGRLRNRGYELEFDGRVIDGKDFKWSLYGNFSINRNKIMEWPEDKIQNEDGDISWAAGDATTGYPALVREGDPLGAFYGFKFIGVYKDAQSTVARDKDGDVIIDLNGVPKRMTWEKSYTFQAGDAMYADLNHDGMINNRDRSIIGDANPDFFGGVGTRFNYKNWRLDMFFQFQYGNDIINQARKDLERQNGGGNSNVNQAQSVMRRWRKQGDVTDMPRVIFATNYNSAGSDKYVEDGSYMRLKSLALSYNVPSDFCKKLGLRSANVTFNAYNLLTFTSYKGQDPEISVGGGIGSMGVDNNRTAVPRSYVLGLGLTF